MIPLKLASLLAPFDWEVFPHTPGTTRSLNIGYLLILLPSFIGFIVMVRRRLPFQWLLWIVLAAVLLQAILFYGSPRFRLPADLIALLPAGVGVSVVLEFLKQRLRL